HFAPSRPARLPALLPVRRRLLALAHQHGHRGMFWGRGRLTFMGAGSGAWTLVGRGGAMRRRRRWVARTDAPRVVVVGAGFAGLAAVAELTRAGMRGMLVDHDGDSTFQPLLYQVATAGAYSGGGG